MKGCSTILALALALGMAPELSAQNLNAKDEIPTFKVTGERQLFPLAIPLFKNVGSATDNSGQAAKLARVIRFDLSMSGVFRVIDPKAYIASSRTEGITSGSIKFRDWLNVGAQGLLKGSFSVAGNRMRLGCALFSVAKGRRILHKTFTGSLKNARRMAHRCSNEVTKYFTGKEGEFTTYIAYVRSVRTRKGRLKNIYLMEYDGATHIRLTNNRALNMLPAWSAKGDKVIFSSTLNGQWQLLARPLRARALQVISSFTGLNIGGSYSPDGSKIALTLSKDGNSEIYILSPRGRIIRRLTRNWGIDSSPSWSPDGKRIAFVSDRSGSPHIYVIGAGGGKARRITFRGNYNQTPEWSPRGDQIAFTARDERYKFDLFLVSPSTGRVKRLTQDQGNNEEPTWSPSGGMIAFASTRNGRSQIFIMNSDGTNQRCVTPGGGVYESPSWSPKF